MMTKTKKKSAEAGAAYRQNKFRKKGFLYSLTTDWRLWLMLLPGLLFYLVFRYGPMFGLLIAFKDYSPFLGVWKSEWIGFENFKMLFSSSSFWGLFGNTLKLGLLQLGIVFPTSIIFALILNEVKQIRMKKFYQTVSYLPNFLSLVIVCGIFVDLFALNGGLVAKIVSFFGGVPVNYIMESEYYYLIYLLSDIWAGLGSGAIIYLAALSGVDQQLYEAADLDGCSRIKKIWHITIPGIMPTIITMFLLRVGNIIRIGADKTILLYQPTTYDVADIFGSYVYRMGIVERNYSFSAAVGLFESVLAALILIIVNKGSKKVTGESLF